MVLHGAVRTSARSLLRLATEAEYRRVSAWSLRWFWRGRRKPGHVRIDGRNFEFPDAASFLSAYEEIFVDRIYAFESKNPRPRILDLGANVGVSVLFFKKLHPEARITAYEPDPQIFAYLERNVAAFGLRDVELRNAAVWTESTTLAFSPDGADAGRVGAGELRVPAVAISEVLGDEHIDFLKMDIEGAENQVLPAMRAQLRNVEHVFVEYHSPAAERQRIGDVIGALTDAGFRLSIQTIKSARSPLAGARDEGDFDLQANVFGWRP
jgi:FkbM family methyltransferase